MKDSREHNPQLKALFDRAASTYDQSRRYLIPRFDDFYGAILESIPHLPEASFHCLDLGAGTGLLSALIAAAFPHAQLTLLDLSEEMLDQARDRFSGISDRFSFIQLDYRQSDPPGRYPVVVSALSIHHLKASEKVDLFQRLTRWLAPGGIFINADQVLGETPEMEAAYHASWLRYVQSGPITPQEYEAAMSRLALDRFSTLSDQLRWLRLADLEQVSLRYQYERFVVYSATRPDG